MRLWSRFRRDFRVDRAATPSRLWINHVLNRTMRSRVRSTRKKPEVFKWTKCMEDFVHGQLEAPGPVSPGVPRCPKALCGRIVIVCCRHRSKSTVGLEQPVKRFPLQQLFLL